MKKRNYFLWIILFTLFCVSLIILTIFYMRTKATPQPLQFDGGQAYQDVLNQLAFGPRTPGSEAHQETVAYIKNQLTKAGWKVEIQSTTFEGHEIKNVIAKRGSGTKFVILGAHYDSRFVADQESDPSLASQPVPGANDGASGVAVLLELARVIPRDIDKEIWLVFFDAEDQGNIPGWDWILGSKAFVASLAAKPDAAVIIDMIGDKELNIYQEKGSTQDLTSSIWTVAAQLGYSAQFIDAAKYSILDDHLPFIQAGIPAVDIIDYDYPYWHTTQDTADKVSAESLKAVGDVLLAWINQ